jgi:uncharacterized protein (AIM24 family)
MDEAQPDVGEQGAARQGRPVPVAPARAARPAGARPGRAAAQRAPRRDRLCSSDGVEIDAKGGGLRNPAGGEGGFLIRTECSGQVVASCYGALDLVGLRRDETLVLGSGHLVAFDLGVSYITRKVTRGLVQTLKTGEGLVFEFTGPGRLWTQSRNPRELTG